MILSTMKKSSCASCVQIDNQESFKQQLSSGGNLRRFTRIYPANEIPPNKNECLNDYLIGHTNTYSCRAVAAMILRVSIR